MSAGIQLPKALQLISGVPLQKVVSVFAEKLSITKRLDGGGGIASLMAQVIRDGNLSSIMQNPMATATQVLQGQLGGFATQLNGIPGASGLISALTGASGLGNALSIFKSAGDNLAGLTNGGSGFFDMLGHATTVDMAGAALPLAATMDAVTAPLDSGALLNSIASQLPPMIAQVVSGQVSPDTATAFVNSQIQTLGAIVAGSSGALAYGAQMHPSLALVASVGGALAVPPAFDSDGYRVNGAPTGFQLVLNSIVQPGPAEVMAASVAAQIRHTQHNPIDVAGMTSLGDPTT
jgi:hypothetical protein